MQRINHEKKKKEPDTSALDILYDLNKEDIEINQKVNPSEIVETEIRIREGQKHKGDKFTVEGIEIYIPQLSFIQLRQATRESLKIFDNTELGKKISYVMRTESKEEDEEELGDLTIEETMMLDSVEDIKDLWLMFFALKDVGYPSITGDFEKDRKFLEYIDNAEEFISEIRRVNGLLDVNLKNEKPSGEEVLKSFHDDGLCSSSEDGTSQN